MFFNSSLVCWFKAVYVSIDLLQLLLSRIVLLIKAIAAAIIQGQRKHIMIKKPGVVEKLPIRKKGVAKKVKVKVASGSNNAKIPKYP